MGTSPWRKGSKMVTRSCSQRYWLLTGLALGFTSLPSVSPTGYRKSHPQAISEKGAGVTRRLALHCRGTSASPGQRRALLWDQRGLTQPSRNGQRHDASSEEHAEEARNCLPSVDLCLSRRVAWPQRLTPGDTFLRAAAFLFCPGSAALCICAFRYCIIGSKL